MSSDDLSKLSDEQLIEFADSRLGIVIEKGTKRSTVMTRIVNAAFATT